MNTKLVGPVLALAALASTGCYTTWDVAPRELRKLSGFKPPDRVVLSTPRGEDVPFDEDTALQFDHGPPTHYSAVEMRGDMMFGKDERGRRLNPVNLRDLALTVEARKLSPGKTAGLVVGVTLGVGATVGVTAGLVEAASSAIKSANWFGSWSSPHPSQDAVHPAIGARRR